MPHCTCPPFGGQIVSQTANIHSDFSQLFRRLITGFFLLDPSMHPLRHERSQDGSKIWRRRTKIKIWSTDDSNRGSSIWIVKIFRDKITLVSYTYIDKIKDVVVEAQNLEHYHGLHLLKKLRDRWNPAFFIYNVSIHSYKTHIPMCSCSGSFAVTKLFILL